MMGSTRSKKKSADDSIFDKLIAENMGSTLSLYSFCDLKLVKIDGLRAIPPNTSVRCEYATRDMEEKEELMNPDAGMNTSRDQDIDAELLSQSHRSGMT